MRALHETKPLLRSLRVPYAAQQSHPKPHIPLAPRRQPPAQHPQELMVLAAREWVLSGHNRQLRKQPTPSHDAVYCVGWHILLAELFGTFGFKAMVGSLAIFLRRDLQMTNAFATEMNSAFLSLCNLTSLVGGYVADKYLGRFATILVFYPILLNGILLCAVGSFPKLHSSGLFLAGLFGGVAVGIGGLRPNVIVLGADQFDDRDPDQREQRASFFNWLYWVWNFGSTLSIGLLSNMSVNGVGSLIPYKFGFFSTFGLAFAAFTVAFGAYDSGGAKFRRMEPHGSALDMFFDVVWQAARRSSSGRLVLAGLAAFVLGVVVTTVGFFIHPGVWLHFVVAGSGAFCVVFGAAVLIVSGETNGTKWLDHATLRFGGSFSDQQVRQVALVMRLMPIMSLLLVFWLVYGQISSNFVLQGCQMDLRMGETTMISSALLSVLVTIVVVVLIPILDRLVYPRLGIRVTLLRKMGAGIFCAALAMIFAGLLEQKRKASGLVPNAFSNCASRHENDPATLPMSSLSVWWQTPQYILIGLGEILTSIASCEFFYSQVPESMRSVCQSLNLLTRTLGYSLGGAINNLFASALPQNLNDGALDQVFFVIAALAFASVIVFIRVANAFEYSSSHHH